MPLQLGKRSFLASWGFCSASCRFVESGPGSSVYLMVWLRILERCRAPDQRPASAAYGRRGALRRFAFSWSEPIPRCALRRSASALRRLARTFLQMRIALFRAISAFFKTAKALRRSSVVEPGRAQTLRQLAFALTTEDSSFSFFIGIPSKPEIAALQPKICRTLHTFTTYGISIALQVSSTQLRRVQWRWPRMFSICLTNWSTTLASLVALTALPQ